MGAWTRIPLFLRMAFILLLIFVLVKFAIRPPLPGSVVILYIVFAFLGVAIYITLEDSRIQEFLSFFVPQPGENLLLKISRLLTLVLIPLLIAFMVFQTTTTKYAPPVEIFQAHPTPPDRVLTIEVPSWAVNPRAWAEADIAQGKELFRANCLPCHGENLDGKGPEAAGFRYPARPANFRDRGTIAQLTLQYVYWRVSEGGIRNQFNTAMPAWLEGAETIHTGEMSSEEIWRVIEYLYTDTGFEPR